MWCWCSCWDGCLAGDLAALPELGTLGSEGLPGALLFILSQGNQPGGCDWFWTHFCFKILISCARLCATF